MTGKNLDSARAGFLGAVPQNRTLFLTFSLFKVANSYVLSIQLHVCRAVTKPWKAMLKKEEKLIKKLQHSFGTLCRMFFPVLSIGHKNYIGRYIKPLWAIATPKLWSFAYFVQPPVSCFLLVGTYECH